MKRSGPARARRLNPPGLELLHGAVGTGRGPLTKTTRRFGVRPVLETPRSETGEKGRPGRPTIAISLSLSLDLLEAATIG